MQVLFLLCFIVILLYIVLLFIVIVILVWLKNKIFFEKYRLKYLYIVLIINQRKTCNYTNSS